MFCPNCGQQRITSETKFCSRCGLMLDFIAEVIANGGASPYITENSVKRGVFTRKNGLVFALLWFMFFALIMTPLFAIVESDWEPLVVAAIIGTMGALLIAIFSLFLRHKSGDPPSQQSFGSQGQISGKRAGRELPPVHTPPAEDYVSTSANGNKGFETGEFAQPPSVTEKTTRLLKKE